MAQLQSSVHTLYRWLHPTLPCQPEYFLFCQMLTSLALQWSLRGGWDECCRHPRIFGSRLGRIRSHARHAEVISNHDVYVVCTYILLSTDTSVEELRETTEALQKAAVNDETFSNIQTLSTVRCNYWSNTYKDDISGVEERSGSRLPGVECGASFSDMSAGKNPHSCFIFLPFVLSLIFSDLSMFILNLSLLCFVHSGLTRLADFLEATQEV